MNQRSVEMSKSILGGGKELIFTESLHAKHYTEHITWIILFNLHDNLINLIKLLPHVTDEVLEAWMQRVTCLKSYNQ